MLALLARIQEAPSQFPEHGLLTVQSPERLLFFSVRKAVLPRTFPYVIFYYIQQNGAVILAVAHCKRRPSYWSQRS